MKKIFDNVVIITAVISVSMILLIRLNFLDINNPVVLFTIWILMPFTLVYSVLNRVFMNIRKKR